MKKYFLPIITTLFIFGCSSTKLYDKETESTKEVEHLKARVWGNEPFWNIDIYETYLIYQTPEHKTNKIKFSQHKSADKIAISSLDKNFPFVIEIEEAYCNDGMSDYEFSYKAGVTMGEQKTSGCVRWVVSDEFLGKWTLKYSKQQDIDVFQNLPFISIEPQTLRVSGNVGCNGLGGRLVNHSEFPKFEYLATTLSWCEDMNAEAQFMQNLKKVNKLIVENNELKGYNSNELLVTFTK